MQKWLRQRLHFSWHIAALSAGLIGGVAMSRHVFWVIGTGMLVGGLSLLVVVAHRPIRLFLSLSLGIGLLGGLWRGGDLWKTMQSYAPYYEKVVIVQGVLAEDVSLSGRGDQQLRLKHVRMNDKKFPGDMWVSLGKSVTVKRSDTIWLRGKLGEGFGSVAVSMHRATAYKIERTHHRDAALLVRDRFAASVRRFIVEPEASLGIGYLTGQRSALPKDFEEQLRIVGLTHAVVASGYNLTILVGFARNFCGRFSKYSAALGAALMVGAFMMVTGLSPSMSRAGLVAMLGIVTWYYGRTVHPVVLLLFSAAVTALVEPAFVWGDMGWYLSFAAFFGVLIMAPLIRSYFWGPGHKPGTFVQIMTDTFSAQLATMPIILLAFGTYSVYALPANLLVLPLVPLVMLLTFIVGTLGLFFPIAAVISAWLASLLLKYMVWIVGFVAELPNAQGKLSFSPWMAVLSYVLIGIGCFLLYRKTKHSFRKEAHDKKVA